MTIGKEPIHGTGLTTGDVIAEAVRQAGGGGSPQAGQPTRFLTLTYHHPGNEDGNSVSATTGIPIPNSTIAEGDAWLITVQLKVTQGTNRVYAAAPTKGDGSSSEGSVHFYYRPVGETADVFGSSGASATLWTTFIGDSALLNDTQFFAGGIISAGNVLLYQFKGMSTNTPTDWTINVQLTPIAP